MSKISSLAAVDPRAELADDVEVGPFCVVGPNVILGSGNRLLSHVVITGRTTVGKNNTFHPNAVIGGVPQDLKYHGEDARLEIGDRNAIREAVTIHIGTENGSRINGGGVTRIGNDNLLMVNCHIGHDAQFGNRCVLANNVMIAGHVVCGDNVSIMGAAGVHHKVTIGDVAYIAAEARVTHDVPPFVKVSDGDQIRAVNSLGLERAGFKGSEIAEIDDAARRMFFGRDKDKSFAQVLAEFDTLNGINPHVKKMIEFLRRRDLGKHGRYLESVRP
jgi:UDP-N-acetylglucosamine acyltransferase